MKNLSFDYIELKESSLKCLTQKLVRIEGLKTEKILDRMDDLLQFLIKEISFAKQMEYIKVYMDGLLKTSKILSVGLVCHLKSILMLILDLLQNEELNGCTVVSEFILVVLDNCWPRLPIHAEILRQIHTLSPKIEITDKIHVILSWSLDT